MAHQQLTVASQFNQFLQKHKGQLEAALPKHLNADRLVRIALTEFSKNPALQKCTPKSIFASLIIAGQLGLEPGVNGQGYLVPYKENCTFVPGWKGLVDLVSRSGRATVWTGAVYEGDDFDYMLGANPYCNHRPNGEFDINKLTHVYAIGKVKDAELPVIEVWTVKRVKAHFEKTVVNALKPNHYSKKHFEMYARKVVLLQVLKYMPQSVELNNAIAVADNAEMGKNIVIDSDFVVVNDETEEQTVMPETVSQPTLQVEQQPPMQQQAMPPQPQYQQPPMQNMGQPAQQNYQQPPQSMTSDDMFGSME